VAKIRRRNLGGLEENRIGGNNGLSAAYRESSA
jgi:hypothetical protein